MIRPLPRHGTRARYLRGCRCTPCGDANYHYMSRWRLDRQRGTNRRTDARPAQDHVQHLLANGWTRADIAHAAGRSGHAITALARRQHPTVHVEVAADVLALHGNPGAVRYRPAIGTARRVRALVAIGHSIEAIANATGLSPGAIAIVARADRPTVRDTTAEAIAALYRRWALTPGPSTRSRLRAAREGWHSPIAWDDIDNPDEQPDTDTPRRRPTRRENAQHVAEEVTRLAEAGLPVHEIAAKVGRSTSYIRSQIRGDRGPGWRETDYQEAA